MSNHNIKIQYDDSYSDDDYDSYSNDDIDTKSTRILSHPIAGGNDTGFLPDIDINLPDRICLLGQSETGKTTIIRYIIKLMRAKFAVACVWWISPNSGQETWIPKRYRRTSISKSLLTGIRELQRTPAFKNSHQIVVLDDCIGENFHRDKFWDDYISTCRHDRVSLIIGLQYLKGMAPVMRENIKQWILTHANNQTLKHLYELSANPNFSAWRHHFSKIEIGHPVMMDVRPNKPELQVLSIPRCEPNDMNWMFDLTNQNF
ncbi:MAG TPA: ATPase/DNA packaging protein [Candidatus Dojkabacteria bacterium]|nr:ATPase/DNA packaging protein [Candidatus Dojkabacteria bacterium]